MKLDKIEGLREAFYKVHELAREAAENIGKAESVDEMTPYIREMNAYLKAAEEIHLLIMKALTE